MDMSAAFNYERTRTHKTPNCRDNYLPDDEDGEQDRPKRKKAKERGCSAARSFELSKTERDPPPTTRAQLITGLGEAFPILVQKCICLMTVI